MCRVNYSAQAKADKALYDAELRKLQEKQRDHAEIAVAERNQERTSFGDQLHKAGNETANVNKKLIIADKNAANLTEELKKAKTEITSLRESLKKTGEELSSQKNIIKAGAWLGLGLVYCCSFYGSCLGIDSTREKVKQNDEVAANL